MVGVRRDRTSGGRSQPGERPAAGTPWSRESSHPDRDVGRGERIRTSGPCLPKAVLYQAELHPELDSAVTPPSGVAATGAALRC